MWWLALIVNLTQPITREESFNGRLFTLHWSVSMSMGIVLIKLTDEGRRSPLWVAPFPRLCISYQSSEDICMHWFLSALDYKCNRTGCLKSPPFLSIMGHDLQFRRIVSKFKRRYLLAYYKDTQGRSLAKHRTCSSSDRLSEGSKRNSMGAANDTWNPNPWRGFKVLRL